MQAYRTETHPAATGHVEPSMSSALSHVVEASQRVITKRIDLALLEGQETLFRSLAGAIAALAGACLACGAWFALIASGVLFLTEGATRATQWALFGLINAVAAAVVVALAVRQLRPRPLLQPHQAEPAPLSSTDSLAPQERTA